MSEWERVSNCLSTCAENYIKIYIKGSFSRCFWKLSIDLLLVCCKAKKGIHLLVLFQVIIATGYTKCTLPHPKPHPPAPPGGFRGVHTLARFVIHPVCFGSPPKLDTPVVWNTSTWMVCILIRCTSCDSFPGERAAVSVGVSKGTRKKASHFGHLCPQPHSCFGHPSEPMTTG